MSSDKNCRCLAPAVLGRKASPFSGMMRGVTNLHSPRPRKNGVEGASEAAPLAATPVSDRLCPTVSHPPGLEASPTGRPPTARGSAVGSPAVDPGHDGHDLGGGGLPTRAVRDGPRVLRGLLRGPQAPRHDPRR